MSVSFSGKIVDDYLYMAENLIYKDRYACISDFNDDPKTTHDQIMNLYDVAISLAQENND